MRVPVCCVSCQQLVDGVIHETVALVVDPFIETVRYELTKPNPPAAGPASAANGAAANGGGRAKPPAKSKASMSVRSTFVLPTSNSFAALRLGGS